MSDCIVSVKVTPRSSRNRLERDGETLRAWLTAPPTDGQANAALCELVAKAVGVPKSGVSVVAGHAGRLKRLRVEGLTLAEVWSSLGERGQG